METSVIVLVSKSSGKNKPKHGQGVQPTKRVLVGLIVLAAAIIACSQLTPTATQSPSPEPTFTPTFGDLRIVAVSVLPTTIVELQKFLTNQGRILVFGSTRQYAPGQEFDYEVVYPEISGHVTVAITVHSADVGTVYMAGVRLANGSCWESPTVEVAAVTEDTISFTAMRVSGQSPSIPWGDCPPADSPLWQPAQ